MNRNKVKNTKKNNSKPVNKPGPAQSPTANKTKIVEKKFEKKVQTQTVEKVPDPPKKVERSNSFYLTRKISEIYNKISGSKENLNKIVEKPEEPHKFQFTRSLSLSTIQIKKSYRRSYVESNLEKLSEDDVLEPCEKVDLKSSNPIDVPLTPKSTNIFSSIKRKLSFSDRKQDKLNSKWSASLQSLRCEDFMVSYDDLSFVNYDLFNEYESKLVLRTCESQLDLSLKQNKLGGKADVTDAVNPVLMRRPRRDSLLKQTLLNNNNDYENNLDKDKNLYRNSLDCEKLKHLSEINRESYRWSANVERDAAALLLLDNYLEKKEQKSDDYCEKRLAITDLGLFRDAKRFSSMSDLTEVKKDKKLVDKLKSRSLTHLDKLEPQIATPTTTTNDYNFDSMRFKNDTSDTSNTSIASVTGSSGFGGDSVTPTSTNNGDGGNECGTNKHSIDSKMSCLSSQSFSHTKPLSSSASLKKKSSSFLHRERKKPILTRSQVSSSEYFSVCFETDNGFKDKDEVFIAATKGVCLVDSLRHSLGQRTLSFSQICVIDNGLSNCHELGIPQFLGPLDAYTDIGSLAGRTLIVTEKDATKKSGHTTLQKAASVGYRTTTNRLFTSASTDDNNYDSNPKATSNKQSKQKWTLPFGSKGPQKSKLCELLDGYNKGIPKPSSSFSNFDNPDYLEALNGLENLPQSWTDIVNCTGMSETETKIQSAIWELVTTEVYYIHALQTVTDLFLACLENVQSQNILTDVDQNKLFSNIRDICESNLKFWTMYLYPMVKHSISTSEPMNIYYFQEGFVDFASIFAPYTKYCAEQSTCQFYCKELYHNNSLFMSYCAWCESQKMCNRLRLADILVRPMQRLTKYGLLLTAIRKHIVDENEGESMDEMIHSVEVFVAGVNSHLTTRQENERLKGINARIDSYEVVDSSNEVLDKMMKQYSTMFDLCQPMRGTDQGRHLFMEGDLKFKDNISKMDVHCFLLTDFLLVCKKNKHENLKVVRQPFMTDRLIVQIKETTLYCCYLNDLNMIVTAFTLQCSKAQCWYDTITKARHIYSRLKQGSAWDIQKYGNTININTSSSNSNNNSNLNINVDNLSIKKSPLTSSIGSRVSSLNNSHSGSVELNESKQVSIDFEKTNSISSDEGAAVLPNNPQSKLFSNTSSSRKVKANVSTLYTTSSNSLTVQPPFGSLGQSMPNLNLNTNQNSNTLSVPGASNSHSHSGMLLLSPSQRGISYPPPSPTRALRRGFAFSSTNKNPPLVKTRNVASQQSFSLTQQQSFNSATLSLQPSTSIQPQFLEQTLPFVRRKNSFHTSHSCNDASDT